MLLPEYEINLGSVVLKRPKIDRFVSEQELLFLKTLDDIEARINTNDPYEILGVSGLIRKLFLDEYPLVDHANKPYRLKLVFLTNVSDGFPKHPKKTLYFSRQDGIDPDIFPTPSGPKILKRDNFFRLPLLIARGNTYTLKEIILFESNMMGGVHFGSPVHDKQKLLNELNQYFSIGGLRASLRQLKAISRIILKTLTPLKNEILKYRYSATNISDKKKPIENTSTTVSINKFEATLRQSAMDALELAKNGNVEYATERFNNIISNTTNLDTLFTAFNFFKNTSNYNKAKETIKKGFSIFASDYPENNTSGLYRSLSSIYFLMEEYEEAENNLHQALNIDKRHHDDINIANNYKELSAIYSKTDQPNKAIEHLKLAINIYNQLKTLPLLAIAHSHIGRIYRKIGNFDQSEIHLLEAIKINKNNSNIPQLASDYGEIANLYFYQGLLNNAESFLHKAIAINSDIKNDLHLSYNYAMLATIKSVKSENKEALTLFHKSLEICETISDKHAKAKVLGHLGNHHLKTNNYTQAEKAYLEAKELYSETKDDRCSSSIENNLSILRQLEKTEPTPVG